MSKTKLRPVPFPRAGLGIKNLTSLSADINRPLPEVQASFLAERFRIDVVRAKLTAELAWGGR